MSQEEAQRQQLLRRLSRGIAYAAPVLALVAGVSGGHAVISDAVAADGDQIVVAEAEGEAEGKAEGEAEGKAEGEAEGEAKAEGEAEGESESGY